MTRKLLGLLLVLLVASACNFTKIDIGDENPGGPSPVASPTATPTPTPSPAPPPGAAAWPGAGGYVRVGVFGFDCPAGITAPNNGAGELPLGCVAHVTATPKYADGSDVPAAIHGPTIAWVVVGPIACTAPAEPYNRDCRGLASGVAQLRATVQGVTGELDLVIR